MKTSPLSVALLVSLLFLSSCEKAADEVTLTPSETPVVEESLAPQNTPTPLAFFYQYVGAFKNGQGDNSVRMGTCEDGLTVVGSPKEVLSWSMGGEEVTQIYGDPVFSRLPDGSWAMTAWSGPNDPRGMAHMLYAESTCPTVEDDAVVDFGAASGPLCQTSERVDSGKTSQLFSIEGANYVFHMTGGEIYLAKLSDSSHSAMDLDALCLLKTPAKKLSDLDYGESTKVIDSEMSDDLLLSDTAIAQRTDGTWVLFVKGVSQKASFERDSLSELCGRSVYRTTSSDLIHWSALEKVVEEASIPEATTTADGTVWLYWQDFSKTCAAKDLNLAALAPISGAYEQETLAYELSTPQTVSFPDEEFESNPKIHYATNANPVLLPDADALEALKACFE